MKAAVYHHYGPARGRRPYRGCRETGSRVEGIAADPTYLDVSVPPGKRKALPVETVRHAFAYVFGGSGTFCNASEPLAVPAEGVGWWRPQQLDHRSRQTHEVTAREGPRRSESWRHATPAISHRAVP
jgi:hypothetical protein